MKPLTANLKQLYQYRFMWVFHLVAAAGFLSMLEKTHNPGASNSPGNLPFILFFLYGEFTCMTLSGTLSKPFAFCLPNHSHTIKKLLVNMWVSIAILCLIPAVLFPLLGIPLSMKVCIAHMGIMPLCFSIGTAVSIRKSQWIIYPAIFSLILIMVFEKPRIVVEAATYGHPWITLITSAVLSYLIFSAIATRNNARALNQIPWFGFPPQDKLKQNRIKQEMMRRKKKPSPSSTVESMGIFVVGRILAGRDSRRLSHLWGQLYLSFAPMVDAWKATLAGGVSIFALYFWFQLLLAEEYVFTLALLVLSSTLGGAFCALSRFNPFQLTGRGAYFFKGIVLVCAATLISVLFNSMSAILINQASIFLPAIAFSGEMYSLSPIQWPLVFVPIVMVPLFGGVFILFRGTVTAGMAAIVSIPSVCILSCYGAVALERASLPRSLLMLLTAAVVTWGIYLAILFFNSMKRALI